MQQESREHDDLETGHDLPNADGQVSDEDVAAMYGPKGQPKGGQDHSLDNYAEAMSDNGVGAVQDSSDTTADVARIDE